MSEAQRPFSQHLSFEERVHLAGMIGDYAAQTPREVQGTRTIVAAPETAEKLRSAYDLDVMTGANLREGQVYVIDNDAIAKAFEGPFIVEPIEAKVSWEPPPLKASDAIIISGVS